MISPRAQKRGGWSKARQAGMRLAELSRLSVFRRKYRLADDIRPLVFIGCDALSLLKHGADWSTVTDWLKRIGREKHIAEPDLMECIHKVSQFRARNPKVTIVNNCRAGEILAVTSAECEALALKTLKAVDEDHLARKEVLRAKRKKRDAERQKEKRRGSGMQSRQDYLAKALTSARPWEDEGTSRRTWERRRMRVASLSPHQ
jgi:hypothetical protein